MKKKEKLHNTLIKRKNLKDFLKSKGIQRINSKALNEIEFYIISQINSLSDKLKEKAIIEGKKTIKEKDIKELLNNKEEYPEI